MRQSARARALVTHSVIAALALASPVIALGQTAAPQTPAEVPPVQAVPGVGGGAGAALPGAMMPPGGASSELGPEPAEFTRYGFAA